MAQPLQSLFFPSVQPATQQFSIPVDPAVANSELAKRVQAANRLDAEGRDLVAAIRAEIGILQNQPRDNQGAHSPEVRNQINELQVTLDNFLAQVGQQIGEEPPNLREAPRSML